MYQKVTAIDQIYVDLIVSYSMTKVRRTSTIIIVVVVFFFSDLSFEETFVINPRRRDQEERRLTRTACLASLGWRESDRSATDR